MLLYSQFDVIFSEYIIIKITFIEVDFLIENGYLATVFVVLDTLSYNVFFFILMLSLIGLLLS